MMKTELPMSTVVSDQIEHLVTLAALAPSVHNTQPWRLRRTGAGLDLSRDQSRQLGVLDPGGRELVLSCGTMLHHLEVAAHAMGMNAEIVLDLTGDSVARIALTPGHETTEPEIATALAILHRHTHRGRFDDGRVSADEHAKLRAAVEQQQGLLRVVRSDELTEVEVLLSRAERALHAIDGYDKELAEWVWQGSDDEGRSDGLPQIAVDHGPDRAESLEGRRFAGPLDRPAEPPAPERPTVVLLSSNGDTPQDWVQTGKALSALLLAATELGLVGQPLGQVIEVPALRRALADLLGIVGIPQMLLRIGHGTSHGSTPRRPAAELLGGDQSPSS